MTPVAPPPARGLDLSVAEAVARIRARDGVLHAFVTTRLAEAEAEATAAARARGPLARVPFALKDVWDVAGLPTTAGSPRNRHAIPAASGPIARAFLDAGAILVGKTNLSDLAFTPECASLVAGRTLHPRDPARTPGGSSGGAAVAVADGMAAFDWGSDFGGSLRLPAAFCGVVGLRLAASTWPVDGYAANALVGTHLNAMGPIAASLDDCRRILEVAAPRLRRGPAVTFAPSGLAVLAPDEATWGAWPGFADDLGAVARTARIPTTLARLPAPGTFDAIFVAVLATHLEQWWRGGLDALASLTVRRLLGVPRHHPDTAHVLVRLGLLRVLRHRDRRAADARAAALEADAQAIWGTGRVIVSPTTTHPAPPHGRVLATRGIASFVKLGNLIDATGLSVPWGTFEGGLPRGLQLLGPPGSELALLDLAARLISARAGRPA